MTTYELIREIREVQRNGLRELVNRHLGVDQRIDYDPKIGIEQTSRIRYDVPVTRIQYGKR